MRQAISSDSEVQKKKNALNVTSTFISEGPSLNFFGDPCSSDDSETGF